MEPWGQGQPPLTTTCHRKKIGNQREIPRTRLPPSVWRTGLLPKVTLKVTPRLRSPCTVKSFPGETERDRQTCRTVTRRSSWRKLFWSPTSHFRPPRVMDRHTAVIPGCTKPRQSQLVPDCPSGALFLSCSLWWP